LDRPQASWNKNLKQNRIENKDEQEHDEHAKNWAEQAPRGRSAERGRTVRQVNESRTNPSREVNFTNASPEIPNGSSS
jgi:hypothetical protein